VLVIGMTNRLEALDKALLRRGRFDNVLKVDMASEEEIMGMLRRLLDQQPCQRAKNELQT
jgi:cell division protease FtsH